MTGRVHPSRERATVAAQVKSWRAAHAEHYKAYAKEYQREYYLQRHGK